MKFCFVGHTYHLKTKSTVFLLDIIKSLGDVDEFHSSPDEGIFSDDALIAVLARSNYDCYIFLQTEYLAEKLVNLGLGRFIIIPMYDGAIGRQKNYWKKFVDAQFISFSRTHHELLRSIDCRSAYFRYFPPVESPSTNYDASDRTGFFWERRPDLRLNVPLVLGLSEQLGIKKLHIHLAPDFAERHKRDKAQAPLMSRTIAISASEWFETRSEFDAHAAAPLFYFAPRASEGIGMAVLEAMGRGQIVVSPDVPTMNEYISHGVSGILYDLERPYLDLDLDEKALSRISRAARLKAFSARGEWEADVDRLKSLLRNDGLRWSTSDSSAAFLNNLRSAAEHKRWAVRSSPAARLPEDDISRGVEA